MPILSGTAPGFNERPPDPASPWLQAGDAGRFGVSIAEKILLSGQKISLPAPGVTAIVGSNNTGKSTLLRELYAALSAGPGVETPSPKVVKDVRLNQSGSVDDMLCWLPQNAARVIQNGELVWVRGSSRPANQHLVTSSWNTLRQDRQSLWLLADIVTHNAEPLQRQRMVDAVESREDIAAPASHPLQRLEDDEDLLTAFNDACKAIFGVNLTLDRLSRMHTLRVGNVGVPVPGVDAVTTAYREALIALPRLSEQGDGMRSMLGLLLPITTATYPIVLVDEPEAFLHRPQATQLHPLVDSFDHCSSACSWRSPTSPTCQQAYAWSCGRTRRPCPASSAAAVFMVGSGTEL